MDRSIIPSMMEVTCAQPTSMVSDLEKACKIANQLDVAVVWGHNLYIPKILEMLKPGSKTVTGTGCGYPLGSDCTASKIASIKEGISLGAKEIDMTANFLALKHGMYDYYYNDVKAIVDNSEGLPVKIIIEVCYLTDDEIKRSCELAVKAGVTYIKTGTGYGPTPTTVDHIKMIKSIVGDDCLIKASGGVRSADVLEQMYEAGARRFGISLNGSIGILEQLGYKLDL
ncbi:MAG: deoxyribose-phosphate aldolase [Christensenellaceae bacterium]|nr:deoxyribose-phosphate aldolase [Christensenellaceae bacterium]